MNEERIQRRIKTYSHLPKTVFLEEWNDYMDYLNPDRHPEPIVWREPETWKCRTCLKILPIDQFTRETGGGRKYQCRECYNREQRNRARMKRMRKKNESIIL